MRLTTTQNRAGFTLGEMLVCVAITSLLFAAMFASSVALNRAYAATNDYFSTHMQQIRIMDYLARDVKRSFSVTTSPDLKTVTCVIPNYIVNAGDPEAASPSLIGTRRTPAVIGVGIGAINKAVVDYGHRTMSDGVTTVNSTSLTSNTAAFTAADVGKIVTGINLGNGTKIAAVTGATSVTLNQGAVATGTGTFTVQGDGDRTVADGVTTSGSTTLSSASAFFSTADIGKQVVGSAFAPGTKIVARTNATTVTLSAAATLTSAKQLLSIGGTVVVYAVSGNNITRTENGVLTTIASSTDSLLPQTTDWQLSNTEFTTTTVTFQPIFTVSGSAAQRSGTTVFATAYLRNKRRGN